MVVPKGFRKKPVYLKQCKNPDCQEEYMGIGTTRYCPKCRAISDRKGFRKAKAIPKTINQIIRQKTSECQKMICECSVCKKLFDIIVYPKDTLARKACADVYPKNCEEHRTEYRINRYYELKAEPFMKGLETL